jgi:hypothetical protein
MWENCNSYKNTICRLRKDTYLCKNGYNWVNFNMHPLVAWRISSLYSISVHVLSNICRVTVAIMNVDSSLEGQAYGWHTLGPWHTHIKEKSSGVTFDKCNGQEIGLSCPIQWSRKMSLKDFRTWKIQWGGPAGRWWLAANPLFVGT